MKILVPVQFVPDLVEELVIDERGDRLDPYTVRWKLNEFDDHAIEEAILLKEKHGGEVTVIAPDFEGVEDALFGAAAKGADRLVRLGADFEGGANAHALACLFLPVVQEFLPDLILTGVQAYNNLDGSLGPLLAAELDWPYVGYVSCVQPAGQHVSIRKEYPGGLTAELEAGLPLVLGIQAAETPPRYVPIAKIRQVMKTARIEERSGDVDLSGGLAPARLFPPETGAKATMLPGSVDEVADRLVGILREQGVI